MALLRGRAVSVGNESYKINEENLGGVFYPSVVDILQLNRMVSVEIDKVTLGQNSLETVHVQIAQNDESQLVSISDVYAESFHQNDGPNLIDASEKEEDTPLSAPSNNSISVKAETTQLTQFKPIELDDLEAIEFELPLTNVVLQLAENNFILDAEQLFAFGSLNEGIEEEAEIETKEIAVIDDSAVVSIEPSVSEQQVYLFDELSDDIGIVFFFDEFGRDVVISDFDVGLDTINLEYFTDNATLLSFLLDDEGFGRATYTASPTDFGRVDIDIEQSGDDVSIQISALSDDLLPGVDGIGKTDAYLYDMTILLEDINVTELELSDFIY